MEILNNLDFTVLFNITDRELIYFFYKAFGIVFSLLFILYAVILERQAVELIETVSTSNNAGIRFGSRLQLILSILLFLFAVFLL